MAKQGRRGKRGAKGTAGAVGKKGAKGSTGLSGSKGAKGVKGAIGLKGRTGLTGKRGAVGRASIASPQLMLTGLDKRLGRIFQELEIQMRRMAQMQAELNDVRTTVQQLAAKVGEQS